MESGTWKVKTGLAQMLKGGVIMDVVTPEHAKIAEAAGACSVMALERVPAETRMMLVKATRLVPAISAALFDARFKPLRRRRMTSLFDLDAIAPSRIAPIAASVRSGVLNLRNLTPCAQLSVFGELRARHPMNEERLDRLMTEWLMRLGATRHTLH